jgi:hypothetical protein
MYNYEEGTIVDLNAFPADGWEFDKWVIDGVDVDTEEAQVTVDADKTVTAHFVVAVDPNPTVAHDPIPAHEATDVPLDTDIGWTYTSDPDFTDPIGYRIKAGVDPEMIVFEEFYMPGGPGVYVIENVDLPFDLENATTYYWQVIPTTEPETRSSSAARTRAAQRETISRGDAVGAPIWSFTTEDAPRPEGSTCDNPYLVTLPLVDYMDNTEDYGNDYLGGWVDPSSSYLNGYDFVAQFEITEGGHLTGSVAGSWTGLFILDQCPDPDLPAPRLGFAGSSTGGTITDLYLDAGTYFAIVSTWPTPNFTDFTLNLSFEPLAVYGVAIDPASWYFGMQEVDSVSPLQEFTITNEGTTALTIAETDIMITGDDADQFVLDNIDAPVTLEFGEFFTIGVQFAPLAEGVKNAVLQIEDNYDAGRSISVTRTDRNVRNTANRVLNEVALTGEGYAAIIITEFPYYENFDGDWSGTPAAPFGWTVVNADEDGYTWSQANTYISPTPSEPYAAHGMGNQDDWLITPPLDLSDLNTRLKWWDKVESADHLNTYDVKVSTTSADIGDFTQNLGTFDCLNTAWTEHTLDLSAYAGQTIYVAFHQTFSNATYWGFGIDDVTIEEIPDAPIFAIDQAAYDFGNVQIGTIASQEFVISNIGGGTLNILDISFVGDDVFALSVPFEAFSLDADQWQAVVVNFTPTVVGEFSADMIVEDDIVGTRTVRMTRTNSNNRNIVNREEHTVNLIGEGFDTTVHDFPWIEDFTDVAVGAVPEGWSTTHTNWSVQNSSNAGGEAPEMRFNWSPQSTDDFYLTSTLLNTAGMDEMMLSFKHYVNDYNGDPYTIKVATIVSGVEHVIHEWVAPDTDIGPETLDFILNTEDHGIGSPLQIAWIFSGNSYEINQWYIDDIYLDVYQEFEPPVEVTLPVDPGDAGTWNPVFPGTFAGLGFGNVTGGGNVTVSFFGYGPPNPNFGGGREAPAILSNYYWNIGDDGIVFTDGVIYLDMTDLPGIAAGALFDGEQTLANDGIVIYKRDTAADPFVLLATEYDMLTGQLWAPIGDSFSEFAIGTNNNVHTLPVELSSFTANVTANMFVELQWIAETETNMLGYHVYRGDSNTLSESYQITGQPIPATNSSEPHSYTYVDEDVLSGNTYYYWLQTIDLDLTHSFHGPVAVTLEDDPEVPDPVFTTALNQNFPNPFNPETTIEYSLREDAEMMELKIYNVLGQLVKTIHAGPQTQGEHTVVWDGRDNSNRNVTSGIYFYRMSTPSYNKIYKMMLLK